MHERNPYKNPLDFIKLSDAYPALQPHVIQTGPESFGINFKDPVAQRCLTEALLFVDFGLQLNLPEGRLCPPVPNRLNYILWIQDIVRATSSDSEVSIGIDIGTGASAIYPLLSSRIESDWKIVGTEIDDVSYNSAIINIANNDLSDRVQILKVTHGDPLFVPILKFPDTRFHFTMCNPPFYSSKKEILLSSDAKLYGPNAVCTGAEIEMITLGGESQFVRRMVDESVTFCNRCLWFTSMLGKLSSVIEVVRALREREIVNYGITELVQGQTRRWVIAWSFEDIRLPDRLARFTSDSLQNCMPLPNTLLHSYPKARSCECMREALLNVLNALEGVSVSSTRSDVSTEENGENGIYRVLAMDNTWSRAARRKKLQSSVTELKESLTKAPFKMSTAVSKSNQMECKISILLFPYDQDNTPLTTRTMKLRTTLDSSAIPDSNLANPLQGNGALGTWYLECTWTRGYDRALFESFWSHVSRKIGSILGS